MAHRSAPAGTPTPVCVTILAHNESNNIIACLDSVIRETPHAALPITVIENGSTDDTARLVETHARHHSNIRLISLELGDKCNAWNHFVHRIDWQADVCVFMDGDCRMTPGSLDALRHCLSRNTHALAATAYPVSGRNVKASRREIQEDHGLVGNLYALRGEFLRRVREKGIQLPIGMVGDDSFLGALVKWNLEPMKTGWVNEHIALCPEAGFSFNSFSMIHPRDVQTYWRRRIRYGRRKFELKMLRKSISIEGGVQNLPQRIEEIYGLVDPVCRLRWNGLQTFFDWLALRQIRKRRERTATVNTIVSTADG